jgi:NUDIX domain
MSPKKRRIDYWQHPDAPKPTNRKASASVVARDESGRVLLLRRPDNDLWTIPTGAVKRGETVAEAAVRECRTPRRAAAAATAPTSRSGSGTRRAAEAG